MSGARMMGASIHLIDAGVDEGCLVAQSSLAVQPDLGLAGNREILFDSMKALSAHVLWMFCTGGAWVECTEAGDPFMGFGRGVCHGVVHTYLTTTPASSEPAAASRSCPYLISSGCSTDAVHAWLKDWNAEQNQRKKAASSSAGSSAGGCGGAAQEEMLLKTRNGV